MPTVAMLRAAFYALSAEVGDAVRRVAADLRPAHGSVMEQLDFEDGLRLVDLATGADMTPQSVGELVDQLETMGYVERRPDPRDRRAKRIYRTEKAKRASAAAIETAMAIERELEQRLGEDRLSSLKQDLRLIIESRGGSVGAPLDRSGGDQG